MNSDNYAVHAAQIFTLFFIMLGPLKLTTPFALATGDLTKDERSSLAIKIGLISTLTLLAGGFIGSKLLVSWRIQPAVLLIAAGVIFFLVALNPLIKPISVSQQKIDRSMNPADLALELVVSPYGMAAVIVLISLSHNIQRLFTIVACLLTVMVLDVITMIFTKPDRGTNKSLVMKILGAALGTLQLALALQIIVDGLKQIGFF